MKAKLTMENLRIFNSLNSNGCVIRTPEASVVGELDSSYRLADWLYRASVKNKSERSRILGMLSILILFPWLVIITA